MLNRSGPKTEPCGTPFNNFFQELNEWLILAEFNARFTDNNVELWTLMEALNPKSKTFLDPFILKPLYHAMTIPNVSRIVLEENAGIDVLGAQCKVHKNVILRKFEHVESIDIMDVLRFLHKDFTATAFILIMFIELRSLLAMDLPGLNAYFQPWLT